MPKSQVCVDANIVVALVTAERFSRTALALWQEFTKDDFPHIRWLGNLEHTKRPQQLLAQKRVLVY